MLRTKIGNTLAALRIEQNQVAQKCSEVQTLTSTIAALRNAHSSEIKQLEDKMGQLQVFGGMDLSQMTIREKDFLIHSLWESTSELKDELAEHNKEVEALQVALIS